MKIFGRVLIKTETFLDLEDRVFRERQHRAIVENKLKIYERWMQEKGIELPSPEDFDRIRDLLLKEKLNETIFGGKPMLQMLKDANRVI